MKFERTMVLVVALVLLVFPMAGCSLTHGPAEPSVEKLQPAEDTLKKRDAEMMAKAKAKMESGQ